MNLRRSLLAACATLALCACSTVHTSPRSPFEASAGGQLSAIRHVVLVKLNDPKQADELIADMDQSIPLIPSVMSYWRGSPFISDRPEVSHDYDVGMIVDFADAAGYDRYVRDRRHVDLVARWKPRAVMLTIYDIAAIADPSLAAADRANKTAAP
ncbi:MAG: Dabb family protein [Phycisphaerales bacterium]